MIEFTPFRWMRGTQTYREFRPCFARLEKHYDFILRTMSLRALSDRS